MSRPGEPSWNEIVTNSVALENDRLRAENSRLRAAIVEYAGADAEWHRAGFGNFAKVYTKASKRMDAATAALLRIAGEVK